MHKLQRKERELERTRRDILDAAARAFVRKGFHGTTMEEVAREAGYAVASLYTYFKGKEQLYRSLLEAITEQFQATYDEPALPALGFRERFAWLLHRQFDLVERNREFFLVLCQLWAAGDGAFADLASSHNCSSVDRMEAFIRAGVSEGALNCSDERTAAHFVLGVTRAAVLRWLSGEQAGPLAESVPSIIELVLCGLSSEPERAGWAQTQMHTRVTITEAG